MNQFAFGEDVEITFGAVDRTFYLAGDNVGRNTLAPLIGDADDGGAVGLAKMDSGMWVVEGDNTYTGPTTVRDGTLIINGHQIGIGDTTVDLTATLGGQGTIGGGLLVAGTVAPGDAIGRLSVVGDATFAAGSTIEIDLGGLTVESEHDVLDVGGSLEINGASLSVFLSGFEPAAGDVFDVIDFGTASGSFGNYVLPGNLSDWDTSRILVDGTLRFLGGNSSALGRFQRRRQFQLRRHQCIDGRDCGRHQFGEL